MNKVVTFLCCERPLSLCRYLHQPCTKNMYFLSSAFLPEGVIIVLCVCPSFHPPVSTNTVETYSFSWTSIKKKLSILDPYCPLSKWIGPGHFYFACQLNFNVPEITTFWFVKAITICKLFGSVLNNLKSDIFFRFRTLSIIRARCRNNLVREENNLWYTRQKSVIIVWRGSSLRLSVNIVLSLLLMISQYLFRQWLGDIKATRNQK